MQMCSLQCISSGAHAESIWLSSHQLGLSTPSPLQSDANFLSLWFVIKIFSSSSFQGDRKEAAPDINENIE